MARAREFDADIALDRAIEMFWARGYAHTSMRELVKYTGVAHAGLYSAFGGKDELFQACLEKYEQGIFAYLFVGMESERASIKDIKKLFAFITTAKEDKYFKHGCFIANTALEFGSNPGPIQNILNRTFIRQVKAFENALSNALKRQQIEPNTDVADSASSFALLFYGCSSLTRMKAPQEIIQRGVSSAFSAIDSTS